MSKPKEITYQYKDIELENYTRSEQTKLDKKLVKARMTGDYSELIETVEAPAPSEEKP